jgi:hypothetical protein
MKEDNVLSFTADAAMAADPAAQGMPAMTATSEAQLERVLSSLE